MTENNRQTGTVTKWLNHRGIGFITPDGEDSEIGKDILVHYSHIKQGNNDGFKSLAEGSKVEFETAKDPKNADMLIAINVTGVGGADCEKRARMARRGGGGGGNEEPGFEVTIQNLSKDTTWRHLKDHFRDNGASHMRRADVDKGGGSGVIDFDTAEDAEEAVERLNGTTLQGSIIEVKKNF